MERKVVSLAVDDAGVAILRLDSPPANALNVEVLAGLNVALDEVRANRKVRVLVVSADGEIFCAGADIKMTQQFLNMPEVEVGITAELGFSARLQQFNDDLERLSVPTIAAIGGAATGGGLELALACDFRIAGEGVMLGLPEVLLGMVPGAGGTQRLTRTVGIGVATRLILCGDLVNGKEGVDIGLVHWAVPQEQVISKAMELAGQLVAHDADAMAGAKECLRLAPSKAGYDAESDVYSRLLWDDAKRENVRGMVNDFLAARARRKSQRQAK